MRPAFSVLAVLALGCGHGGGDDGGGGTGQVTLGTGTTEFEALTPGQDLEVIAGPQGGHHFFVHARMSGLDPGDPAMPGLLSNPATTFAAFDSGGTQIDFDFPPYRLGYIDTGGGQFELPSGRILQIEDSLIPGIYGQTVRITIEVRDDKDRVATDEVEITAIEQLDPPDGGDAGVDGG